MGVFRQFGLLLWKNILKRVRSPVSIFPRFPLGQNHSVVAGNSGRNLGHKRRAVCVHCRVLQITLGLEILWPIVIFLVICLVRLAVPPEDVPTCKLIRCRIRNLSFVFTSDQCQRFDLRLGPWVDCTPDKQLGKRTKLARFPGSVAPQQAMVDQHEVGKGSFSR